jgi:hypothetical protein
VPFHGSNMKQSAFTPTNPNPAATDLDATASEFISESALSLAPSDAPRGFRYRTIVVRSVFGALVLTALGLTAFAAGRLNGTGTADAALHVASEPSGAEVSIDGHRSGTTPATLMLAPGAHDVTVRHGNLSTNTRVTLASAERATYHIAWPPQEPVSNVSAAGVPLGSLAVATDPPAGSVTLDGVARGVAPLVIESVAAGEHELTVTNQGSTYRRKVTVQSGTIASVIVRSTPANTAAGWLTVSAPLTLQVHEAGRMIGTTEPERIMLAVGEHQLDFSNDAAGFRVSRTIRIVAGDTTPVTLQVPRVPVNVNAMPWAEVWVDDQRVGETPIGNYPMFIGTHTVELRHPQLGTKRVTVAVSLKSAARVAVDMRER